MSTVNDYTALLSGSYWTGIEVTGKPTIVTYSFPTAAPSYDAQVDGFGSSTVATFQAFNTAEISQAKAALGEWAAASGLTFIQVAPGQGDINFQLVDFNTTSYAGAGGIGFYPFGNWDFSTYPSFSSDLDASGDVFMNTRYVANGQVDYGTLLHEIGHAIGLKHPTETVVDAAADPDVTHDQVLSSDDPTRTVMATVGDNSGTVTHLKDFDKQAAAFIYGTAGQGGVVTGSASGSNTALASWSWDDSRQTLTENGFATADVIRGSSVIDHIYGNAGNDKLYGLNGADILYGGADDDFLDGGPGADKMYGGTGAATFVVDNTGDRVYENVNEGIDTVFASVNVTLAANVEKLQLFGSGLTGKGNDLDNTIFGDGVSATKLYGLDGADYIVGGNGADRLDGGTGNDSLFGGNGNDTILSGDGDDRLVGGAGIDSITGGAGSDTFVLTSTAADHDTIRDFMSGTDHLEVSAAAFGGGLTAGALASSQFLVNATGKAADADDRFIYDSGNGRLYYDANGSASGGSALIGTLTGAPTLTAGDFNIVA